MNSIQSRVKSVSLILVLITLTFILCATGIFASTDNAEMPLNESATADEYIPGDVNSDGEITVKDTTLIRRYIAEYEVTINKLAADVDADCDITPKDTTMLRLFIAQYDVQLLPSPKKHSMESVPEKAPTCTEEGNIAYWECTLCGKNFVSENDDADEITDADTVLNPLGHTDENADNICDVCELDLTPPIEMVDLLTSYKIVYKSDSSVALDEVSSLIDDIKSQTGKELSKVGGSSPSTKYEIIAGYVSSRKESRSENEIITEYSNSVFSVYSIKFYNAKLVIGASDNNALKCALVRLRDFLSDGSFSVPKNINEFVVFDTAKYLENGTVFEYAVAELDRICTLDSLSLNGNAIESFNSENTSYFAQTDIKAGYPTVTAKATMNGASVEIIQPNAENGGMATVKVISKDGKNTKVYTVEIEMNDEYKTDATVVTKDGKDGVVTIVLDDGNTRTGERVKELLAKYPEMTVTFAMITRKLAGFQTNSDGSAYLRDENGNFILTQTDAQKTATAFWKELLALYPQVEIANHSHTHAYAGEDDTVLYTAYDDNGKKYLYPAGSISAEVYGASQIIRELFGQQSAGFIIPGISRTGSDWTIDSWWPYIKSGSLLGARLTSSSTNAASMVMMPDDFKNEKLRWNGRAFMIRYWNMAKESDGTFYDQSITYDQAIAAGIKHTTDFIDAAIEKGGWACFCLHDIILKDQTGTHPIYMEQADALFSYVNALSDSGSAWVATYGDALTYYTEWASAVPTATAHGDRYIDLSLTCEEKNSQFDMPLTVKVSVPDTWERCEFDYENAKTELEIHTNDDGTKYVYANIVPETFGTINPII